MIFCKIRNDYTIEDTKTTFYARLANGPTDIAVEKPQINRLDRHYIDKMYTLI